MISESRYFRMNYLLVCLIVPLLTSGCVSSGQKRQIERFSISTDVIIKGSRTALQLAQDSEKEYLINEVTNKSDLRPQYFSPLLDKKAIQTRIELLTVLDLYAEGLRLLVKDDESKEIEDAALNLQQSTGSLVQELGKTPLGDRDKELLGLAVNAIGQSIVEAMRGVSLRSAVRKADGNITNMVVLLSRDIGEWDSRTGIRTGLRAKIYEEYETRRSDLEKDYEKLSSREQKEKLIRRYLALMDERDQVDGLLGETRESIQKFAKAHGELCKSLRWTNIFGGYDSLRDQIDAMVQHVRRIKEFQDRLKED